MTRVYYKEAVGALVVFDVMRATTFDAVLKWKDDLDSKVSQTEAFSCLLRCLLSKLPYLKSGINNMMKERATIFC